MSNPKRSILVWVSMGVRSNCQTPDVGSQDVLSKVVLQLVL